MKTKNLIILGLVLFCTSSFAQRGKRPAFTPITLQPIPAQLDTVLSIKKHTIRQSHLYIPLEISAENNTIYIDCRPVPKQPTRHVDIPTKLEFNLFRTPRRDISIYMQMSGAIEAHENDFRLRGTKNQPLVFIDGVKSRSIPTVPVAAIKSVDVISLSIPAEYGDTYAGVLSIYTY